MTDRIYWAAQVNDQGPQLIGLEKVSTITTDSGGYSVADFRCVMTGRIYPNYRVAFMRYKDRAGLGMFSLTPELAVAQWKYRSDNLVEMSVANPEEYRNLQRWRDESLSVFDDQLQVVRGTARCSA